MKPALIIGSTIVRLLDAPCTHISPVGTGMYGDHVEKLLTQAGVPITVRVPDMENGCCYCLVEESGERTFMSYHGAEYTFRKEWMKPYCAENFELCYVCGIEVEEPTGILPIAAFNRSILFFGFCMRCAYRLINL